MEKRLVLFLILSSVIFFGWSYLYGKLYPPAPKPVNEERPAAVVESPTPPAGTAMPAPEQKQVEPVASATHTEPVTNVASRTIKLATDNWTAVLSNQGGVITEWTMTSYPSGKPIDPPDGVNLISTRLSNEIGGHLRFSIPNDPALEKELNTAHYEVKDASEDSINLRAGERKDISFYYANNGVEASKTLTFRGSGYENATGFDFDIRASVKRNGAPVDAYLVIGPNFGDQNAKVVNMYRHAPQLTYAVGSSVDRVSADSLKGKPFTPASAPVTWAAVDDNYFAMAIVPPVPVPAVQILNDHYVSFAVLLTQGEIQHIYAGPKDLNLLSQVSENSGIARNGSRLEDIISYGWLNHVRFLVKPIAQFMLNSLRFINRFTHNFGWSIIILTILLNMLFFPLRWKSSVTMKRAAAMQPRMKDLQERMKKLDKNDPRFLDLQREQIALMKEGNPLLGCLPMLLQMPFFMAVYAILIVSIEVRNAPFFGWLKDLSSPDPYWILPITMCVTMVLQQALTPNPSADPVQKKVGYLMPLIFTWFLKSAPAGLVLYWMVSNLVGVAQQIIINRLNPTNPPAAASTSDLEKPGGQKPPKKKKTKEALAN